MITVVEREEWKKCSKDSYVRGYDKKKGGGLIVFLVMWCLVVTFKARLVPVGVNVEGGGINYQKKERKFSDRQTFAA